MPKVNRHRTQDGSSANTPLTKDKEQKRRDMIREIPTAMSQQLVRETWPPISQNGQTEILKIMDNVSVPILNSIQGEKKKVELQRVLLRVRSNVQHGLPDWRVPASTKEIHYSYDSLVNKKEQLELALLRLLEQISMLEQEVLKEEQRLKEDQKYLEQLRRNAREQGNLIGSSAKQVSTLTRPNFFFSSTKTKIKL